MGKRVADLTPEQLERRRANDRARALARPRVVDMAPEPLDRKRALGRVENMTPEQLGKNRARFRKENMTPEQLERRRAYDRARGKVENMTNEQLERLRSRRRNNGAEAYARKAPDLEVLMLNKVAMAASVSGCTYCVPSTCPPELAAKLAPVLEMLKTADAAQREAIRGVVRMMRAARELELAESVAQ